MGSLPIIKNQVDYDVHVVVAGDDGCSPSLVRHIHDLGNDTSLKDKNDGHFQVNDNKIQASFSFTERLESTILVRNALGWDMICSEKSLEGIISRNGELLCHQLFFVALFSLMVLKSMYK